MNKLFTALATGALLLSLPGLAVAQDGAGKSPTDPKPISIELKDAPIRQGLEQLFKTWGVDYLIDQNVSGFINLKLTDQAPENALKLMLRGNSIPLIYTHEGGVYIIKVRPLVTSQPYPLPPPPLASVSQPANSGAILDVITLLHTDPLDLAGLLGVIEVPFGTRYGNPSGSGIGAGGGGNGFGGGLLGGGAAGGIFGGGPQGGGSGIGPGGAPGGAPGAGRPGGGNLGGNNPNNPGGGNRGPGSTNSLNPGGYVILGTQDNKLIVVKP